MWLMLLNGMMLLECTMCCCHSMVVDFEDVIAVACSAFLWWNLSDGLGDISIAALVGCWMKWVVMSTC